MITVSIALATYNGEKYLRAQLDSLAEQTYLPTEVVISDDGSSDLTLTIIEDFAGTAPFPVRVHRHETRLGYRGNFMRCAGLCRSDLIAFSDQDDIWYPAKIAKLVHLFEDPEILLVHHNADVVTATGTRIGSLKDLSGEPSITRPLGLHPWTIAPGFTQVFRRSLIRFSELWPLSLDENAIAEPLAHDQWFFFLASVLGKIVHVPTPLAAYRQHGQNTCGWRGRATLLQQILGRLINSAGTYSDLARAAEARSLVLKKMDGAGHAWEHRVALAVTQYEALTRWYSIRSDIYRANAINSRLRASRTILRERGYSNSVRWSFGRRGLLKDAFLGVPLGPKLEIVGRRLALLA